MERIVTKGEFIKTIETIKKIQEEIRKFTPIVSEELKSLSDSDYIAKVCNNSIETKITTAKEGDFLFQCSFHNKRYFDRINLLKRSADYKGLNRQKIPAGFIEDKAGVDVNVAGISKFITDCPRAGEFLCKLRYFTDPARSGEDYKEKVKNL
jgi:hypothetical protein